MAEQSAWGTHFTFRTKKTSTSGKIPIKAGMLSGIGRFQSVPTHSSPSLHTFEQAAGHSGALKAGPHGKLLKRADPREVAFYQLALVGQWKSELIPAFYGRSDDGQSIILENLTAGMRHPCVADFKMGIRTAEEHADKWKRFRMRVLDGVTGTREVGIRLEGLSMYRSLEKLKVKGTKQQSHTCSIGCKTDEILAFFLTDQNGLRSDVAHVFLERVNDILQYFEQDNDRFMFLGSSLLLIYDNNNLSPRLRWARALQYAELPRWRINKFMKTTVDVRMIDFAHFSSMSQPAGPKDPPARDLGYIHGLKTLSAALESICNLSSSKPRFEFSHVVKDAHKSSSSSLGDDLECSNSISSSEDDNDTDDCDTHSRARLRRIPRRTFDHMVRRAITRDLS